MVRQDTELSLCNAHVVFMYAILLNYTSSFNNLVFPSYLLCNFDLINIYIFLPNYILSLVYADFLISHYCIYVVKSSIEKHFYMLIDFSTVCTNRSRKCLSVYLCASEVVIKIFPMFRKFSSQLFCKLFCSELRLGNLHPV